MGTVWNDLENRFTGTRSHPIRTVFVQTEEVYVSRIKKYILLHNKIHPLEMGKPEIGAFLSHLTVDLNAAPAHGNRRSAVSLPTGA